MSELEWEKLQDKVDKLPQTLIDFLMDYKTSQFFRQLALEKGLTDQQNNQLLGIIREVAVGNIRIEDLAIALASLRINPVMTSDIVRKIMAFLPVPQNTYPGQDLLETGGNIIDLRNQK